METTPSTVSQMTAASRLKLAAVSKKALIPLTIVGQRVNASNASIEKKKWDENEDLADSYDKTGAIHIINQ